MSPSDREKRRTLRAQLQARLDELRNAGTAEIVSTPEETFGDASVALESQAERCSPCQTRFARRRWARAAPR
jgi:hypothetical protein